MICYKKKTQCNWVLALLLHRCMLIYTVCVITTGMILFILK